MNSLSSSACMIRRVLGEGTAGGSDGDAHQSRHDQRCCWRPSRSKSCSLDCCGSCRGSESSFAKLSSTEDLQAQQHEERYAFREDNTVSVVDDRFAATQPILFQYAVTRLLNPSSLPVVATTRCFLRDIHGRVQCCVIVFATVKVESRKTRRLLQKTG